MDNMSISALLILLFYYKLHSILIAFAQLHALKLCIEAPLEQHNYNGICGMLKLLTAALKQR